MYLLYSVLYGGTMLLGAPYWLYRMARENRSLDSLRQRLGWSLPARIQGVKPLWIHAVSVGEVLAARTLLNGIAGAHPELPLILSTVTVTGQALAQKEAREAQRIFYFPLDLTSSVGRFLDTLEPRAVVLIESEMWPNFLRGCAARRIPVFLANARMSDRSLKRYRRVPAIARRLFEGLELIGAQSHEDKRRFVELGARDDQVRVTGNLKFDFPAPEVEHHRQLLSTIQARLGSAEDHPVVLVGSSMKGEEPIFIDAFAQLRRAVPHARLILAPRHPERFDEVARMLAQAGLSFARRSELHQNPGQPLCDAVLLDSIGELRAVYSLATVAVIGGSFLPCGGHNLLEPAAFGKPIIFGPEMTNFRDMARLFLHEQAARQSSADALAPALVELITNPRARALLGQRAAATFRQNQGAVANTLDLLVPRIS